MSDRIEDYAIIGDCETVALVNRRGSVDWLCWPHFASPACFAALVGTTKTMDTGRLLPQTLHRGRAVISTTLSSWKPGFETHDGAVALVDFMPIRGRNSDLVRIVRGIHGEVAMTMELVLRFDYGRSVPWVTRLQDGALRAIAGPDMVVLHSATATRGENLKTVSEFTIHEGETAAFVLTYGPSYEDLPQPVDPEEALQETIRFWQDWAGQAKLTGEYADAVERSLITLKALTLPPDRRNRGCADHVSARTARRTEKLGLSLLLAS